MNGKTPHIVQYQGSKRILAPQIIKYMLRHFNRLFEPFSGMAAISIAVVQERKTEQYYIDINAPLVNMLKAAVEEPQKLIERYILYGVNNLITAMSMCNTFMMSGQGSMQVMKAQRICFTL